MKTFKSFLFVLIAFLAIFSVDLQAQTTTNNMRVYERAGGLDARWDAITVDSAGVVWSQIIDLSNYDDYAWITDGVYYGGMATTASGNPKLLLDYYVCYGDPSVNGNWILGNDSLATVNATTVFRSSTTRMTVKAPYIKFRLENLATGVAVTRFDFGIYFIKRDH